MQIEDRNAATPGYMHTTDLRNPQLALLAIYPTLTNSLDFVASRPVLGKQSPSSVGESAYPNFPQ